MTPTDVAYLTHWLMTAAGAFVLLLLGLLCVFLEKRTSHGQAGARSSRD